MDQPTPSPTELAGPTPASRAARAPTLPALWERRYRVTSVLGQGATGVVLGAHDIRLGRPVALKQLFGDPRRARVLLAREARALAAIDHPNVIALHEAQLDAATPFLVMEWFDGHTLAELLQSERITLDRALRILRQAANGLDAIHSAGLVHGDVKPSNVLVDAQGRVKIADAGLAIAAEEVTCGDRVGTPGYIAPERRTDVAIAVGAAARADVFSFGVLCFRALAGRSPFDDQSPPAKSGERRVTRVHCISEVTALSRAFDEPLARALAHLPAARPATCGALVTALEAVRGVVDAIGRPLRILVIDDEEEHRAMISTTLAQRLRGAEIESASDGAAALGSVAVSPPHVVLLDLCMPGLSATEIARGIRERAPAARIIVVSGHGSGPERIEMHAVGVRRFLVKPVDAEELVSAIRAC